MGQQNLKKGVWIFPERNDLVSTIMLPRLTAVWEPYRRLHSTCTGVLIPSKRDRSEDDSQQDLWHAGTNSHMQAHEYTLSLSKVQRQDIPFLYRLPHSACDILYQT